MFRFGEEYMALTDKYWDIYAYCMKLVDKHPKIKSGSVNFDEWMRKGKNHISHARGKYIRKKVVSHL